MSRENPLTARNLVNRLWAQFFGAGRIVSSQVEHGKVVDAIRRGAEEEAAEAMRAHIRVVREAYETLVPEFGTMAMPPVA